MLNQKGGVILKYTPSPSELRQWYEKEFNADLDYVNHVAQRNNENYKTVMHRYQKGIIEYIAMDIYYNPYHPNELLPKQNELYDIQKMVAEAVGIELN